MDDDAQLIQTLFQNMTNYVVLLGFTLFPALREMTIDTTVYLCSMLTLGTLAAMALWHQDRLTSTS